MSGVIHLRVGDGLVLSYKENSQYQVLFQSRKIWTFENDQAVWDHFRKYPEEWTGDVLAVMALLVNEENER